MTVNCHSSLSILENNEMSTVTLLSLSWQIMKCLCIELYRLEGPARKKITPQKSAEDDTLRLQIDECPFGSIRKSLDCRVLVI